jgi:hypothetical protein
MKTIKNLSYRGFLAIAALTIALGFAGVTNSNADYYQHDHNGYWDNHHSYHHYSSYHGHQGYWYPQPNGVRIWINV